MWWQTGSFLTFFFFFCCGIVQILVDSVRFCDILDKTGKGRENYGAYLDVVYAGRVYGDKAVRGMELVYGSYNRNEHGHVGRLWMVVLTCRSGRD